MQYVEPHIRSQVSSNSRA